MMNVCWGISTGTVKMLQFDKESSEKQKFHCLWVDHIPSMGCQPIPLYCSWPMANNWYTNENAYNFIQA